MEYTAYEWISVIYVFQQYWDFNLKHNVTIQHPFDAWEEDTGCRTLPWGAGWIQWYYLYSQPLALHQNPLSCSALHEFRAQSIAANQAEKRQHLESGSGPQPRTSHK